MNDVFNSDGTLNVDYIRRLVDVAEKRGWLKRSRWLTEPERNAALRGAGKYTTNPAAPLTN